LVTNRASDLRSNLVCTGNVVNIRPIIIGTIVSICSTSNGYQIWWLRTGMKYLFQTIMLSHKNLGYGFLFKIARIVNKFACYGMNEITVLFNNFLFNLLLCLVPKIFNFFNTTTPSVNLFHLINFFFLKEFHLINLTSLIYLLLHVVAKLAKKFIQFDLGLVHTKNLFNFCLNFFINFTNMIMTLLQY